MVNFVIFGNIKEGGMELCVKKLIIILSELFNFSIYFLLPDFIDSNGKSIAELPKLHFHSHFSLQNQNQLNDVAPNTLFHS